MAWMEEELSSEQNDLEQPCSLVDESLVVCAAPQAQQEVKHSLSSTLASRRRASRRRCWRLLAARDSSAAHSQPTRAPRTARPSRTAALALHCAALGAGLAAAARVPRSLPLLARLALACSLQVRSATAPQRLQQGGWAASAPSRCALSSTHTSHGGVGDPGRVAVDIYLRWTRLRRGAVAEQIPY